MTLLQKLQRVSSMEDATESTLARVLRRKSCTPPPQPGESRNSNDCVARLSSIMKSDIHKVTIMSGLRSFYAEVRVAPCSMLDNECARTG